MPKEKALALTEFMCQIQIILQIFINEQTGH